MLIHRKYSWLICKICTFQNTEVPMNKIDETPEQRFKRLAELRTNQVLDKLRVLGNCSNNQSYKYNREDIEKIFSCIEKKAREMKAKFNHYDTNKKFKL